MNTPKQYMNPYLAGIFLGLILLSSFIVLGAGLGASAGLARVAAFLQSKCCSAHVLSSEYFGKWGENPLNYYLVYMFLGVIIGGLFSSIFSGRINFILERGRKASPLLRSVLAIFGGILIGYASRLAQGCTSGQALTGGALLLTGSLFFMGAIFAGGYIMAFFVRRQWHD